MQKLLHSIETVINIQASSGSPENDSDTPASVELLHNLDNNSIQYRFKAHKYSIEQTFELTFNELQALTAVDSIEEFLQEEDYYDNLTSYLAEYDLQNWQYWIDEPESVD